MSENQNIIIYHNNEGGINVEVKLLDDNLWLSLNQITKLTGITDKMLKDQVIDNSKVEELGYCRMYKQKSKNYLECMEFRH